MHLGPGWATMLIWNGLKWGQPGLFMSLPPAGRAARDGWLRMASAGRALLCSTRCLISQLASAGPFLGRQRSKRGNRSVKALGLELTYHLFVTFYRPKLSHKMAQIQTVGKNSISWWLVKSHCKVPEERHTFSAVSLPEDSGPIPRADERQWHFPIF